ncbi:hypothetical protein FDENT_11139 [Fusarium denticulatum]|uniref:Actin-like ATPase domain-containing protein n=1 Tax=Fusarium denticulatum TaxID=48507 RepID=A0A8H5WUJ4_9HYPO|nr:hypothetical protein FDENT_11139 [Fusarium denticulatum]
MDSSSGSRTRVVVGLDLGTTFSGISYAVLPQNLNGPVSFWWKVGSSHQPKIPTQVEVSGTPIEWFKLSILHRDDLEKEILASETFNKSNSARERTNLTATDVTAKYLCNIWKVFLNELQKMIGDAHIQITITVPVLWPDYARKAIYDALHQADIISNNVELAPKFVAEPEAAALATFSAAYYHVDGTPFSKVQPGQVVIVCDCGGGTTDTAVYEIRSVHPLRVKEVLKGRRIFAGACIMDDGFMKLLKERIAQVISPRVFQTLKDEDFAEIAYTHWDNDVKKSFSNNFQTKRIELPFHWVGSQHRRMPVGQSVHVEFNHNEIASIFNPIVEKITHLIEEEILDIPAKLFKDVTYLIMAGGFSQNLYLRHQISQTVNRVSPDTNTLDYPNGQGWNAVSMGAVIHALQAQAIQQPVLVTSRIVRASWGVRERDGHSIFWLVVENESLDAAQPNLRRVPAEALSTDGHTGGDNFSIRVYSRQLQNEAPRVQEVCILRWKTVDVGLDSDMKPVLKAALQIEFKWDGAAMDFSLFYGGVQQSSVEVKHPWDA